MKKVAVVAIVAMSLSGCTSLFGYSQTHTHVAEAAVIGAVAGGIIGGIATGHATGAALGAGIGAAAGAAIAAATQQQ